MKSGINSLQLRLSEESFRLLKTRYQVKSISDKRCRFLIKEMRVRCTLFLPPFFRDNVCKILLCISYMQMNQIGIGVLHVTLHNIPSVVLSTLLSLLLFTNDIKSKQNIILRWNEELRVELITSTLLFHSFLVLVLQTHQFCYFVSRTYTYYRSTDLYMLHMPDITSKVWAVAMFVIVALQTVIYNKKQMCL